MTFSASVFSLILNYSRAAKESLTPRGQTRSCSPGATFCHSRCDTPWAPNNFSFPLSEPRDSLESRCSLLDVCISVWSQFPKLGSRDAAGLWKLGGGFCVGHAVSGVASPILSPGAPLNSQHSLRPPSGRWWPGTRPRTCRWGPCACRPSRCTGRRAIPPDDRPHPALSPGGTSAGRPPLKCSPSPRGGTDGRRSGGRPPRGWEGRCGERRPGAGLARGPAGPEGEGGRRRRPGQPGAGSLCFPVNKAPGGGRPYKCRCGGAGSPCPTPESGRGRR